MCKQKEKCDLCAGKGIIAYLECDCNSEFESPNKPKHKETNTQVYGGLKAMGLWNSFQEQQWEDEYRNRREGIRTKPVNDKVKESEDFNKGKSGKKSTSSQNGNSAERFKHRHKGKRKKRIRKSKKRK